MSKSCIDSCCPSSDFEDTVIQSASDQRAPVVHGPFEDPAAAEFWLESRDASDSSHRLSNDQNLGLKSTTRDIVTLPQSGDLFAKLEEEVLAVGHGVCCCMNVNMTKWRVSISQATYVLSPKVQSDLYPFHQVYRKRVSAL